MAVSPGPRLELRAQQRLALTPNIRTRLAILRMSPLELAEEIAREAAQNPFLLHDPTGPSTASQTLPIDDADLGTARAEPFQNALLRQIADMGLPEPVAAAAQFLIAELDGEGMLGTDLDALADEFGLPLDVLGDGLAALHRCHPPGVGARGLAECLALQLVAQGLDRSEADRTVANLDGFGRQDWAGLQKALGLNQDAVIARAALLRSLSPRPIVEDNHDPTIMLRADLRVELCPDGEVSVTPTAETRPALRLDQALVARARQDGFAPEMLDRAKALIAAIEQRGRTLERIGAWLAQKQSAFFLLGPESLKPATRVDLANDLGLHPSTVGRAIAGKAIEINGKLWRIEQLFSASLSGEGGPVAAGAVQFRISNLIAAEPGDKPLSDDAITKILCSEGVDISRRTVAKYRQGLRIPSSAMRRRMAIARRGT